MPAEENMCKTKCFYRASPDISDMRQQTPRTKFLALPEVGKVQGNYDEFYSFDQRRYNWRSFIVSIREDTTGGVLCATEKRVRLRIERLVDLRFSTKG